MLGMLAEPRSGYDIKKRFDESLRNFWRAELSQIYPLLQRMESDGLLKSRAGASDIGPTRRVYRRTAKGKRELLAWLANGPTVGTEKIGYLSQVFFLGQLESYEDATRFFEDLRTHMQEWKNGLQQIEDEWRRNDPRFPNSLPDDEFYQLLTLQFGLSRIQAVVDWCDQSLKTIQTRAASTSLREQKICGA